jgi:hypothetical protein
MNKFRGTPVKRILPFHVVVSIESTAETIAGQPGYRHTAKAIGIIDGETVDISVTRSLGWAHVEYLSHLTFAIEIDGAALVPLINTKNRT